MRRQVWGRQLDCSDANRLGAFGLVVGVFIATFLYMPAAAVAGTKYSCDQHASFYRDYERTAIFKYLYEIRKNLDQALTDCRIDAAKHDVPRLKFLLGRVELVGGFTAAGLENIRLADKRNYPAASYYLGMIHEIGVHVTKDTFAAAKWYVRAHGLGHPDGTAMLALLLTPEGQKSLPQAAKQYLRSLRVEKPRTLIDQAVEKGSGYAFFVRYILQKKGYYRASNAFLNKALRQAMFENVREALYAVGVSTLEHSPRKKHMQALKFIAAASERDHQAASLFLYQVWRDGTSVGRDLDKSRKFYCRLADTIRDRIAANKYEGVSPPGFTCSDYGD